MTPGLQQQLTAASLAALRSHNGRRLPSLRRTALAAATRDHAAHCRVATLQPADPTINAAVTTALQTANARNYADGYVGAMVFNVRTLLLAFVCGFALRR